MTLILFLLPLILFSQNSPLSISPELHLKSFKFKRDSTNVLSIDTINKFELDEVSEKDLNWGLKNGTYWFQINISKNNPTSKYYFWELETVHADNFELYSLKNDKWQLINKSGNNISIEKKAVFSNFQTIKTTLSNENSFLIKVTFNQEANFPLKIKSEKEYFKSKTKYFIKSGVYYGFALIILMINLILFFYSREKIYLHYEIFLLAISLSLFYDDGFFSVFTPYLHSYFHSIELLLHWISTIGATLFCFSFLDVRNEIPKIRKWFWSAIIISGGFYLIGYTQNLFTLSLIGGYLVYLVYIGTFSLCIYMWNKKPYARILVIAYAFILVSSMAHFLLKASGNQIVFISLSQIKIGGFIEMIILSAAISYRFDFIQKENKKEITQLNKIIEKLNATTNKAIDTKKNITDIIKEFCLEKKFSKRETEVFTELAKGKTNPQISEALYISISTVKFHTSNIYKKLEVSNRNDAIQLAKIN